MYSFEAIPILGEIFACDRQSYQYLVESIRLFPPQVCDKLFWTLQIHLICAVLLQDEFSNMIEDAGFSCVKYENLSLGIAAIHSGFKLEPSNNCASG